MGFLKKIKALFLKKANSYLIYFIIVFVISLFVFIFHSNIFLRFTYELKEIFTWDTTMYYAVGKGMSHGLLPYSGLYENKPPMIFFLAEISYSLTGGFYLCNVISFILLIFLAFVPTIYVINMLIKRKNKNIIEWLMLLSFAILCGILFSSYDQIRSGEVQVEHFGSAFIILYFLIIKCKDSSTLKPYSASVIFAALSLMIGIMFKEPFLLISIAGALIICKNKKDYLYKLILPLIYGGLLGVILLAASGSLKPYLTIYLSHMLNSHISTYGSPFERMLHINKLIKDLTNYSELLAGIVISLYVLLFYKQFKNITKSYQFIISLIKLLLIVYISSFVVGLGGQYYNHHYIFAFPIYMLLVLETIELMINSLNTQNEITTNSSFMFNTTLSFNIFILIAISLLPNFSYNQTIINLVPTMKEQASYVDRVLDYYDQENYQYFGFNGPIFYAYTKHDPKGPVFCQDPNNFKKEDFFTNSLIKQIQEVNIVVVSSTSNCGITKEYIDSYIKENFILLSSDISTYLEIPSSFNYTMYIRSNL